MRFFSGDSKRTSYFYRKWLIQDPLIKINNKKSYFLEEWGKFSDYLRIGFLVCFWTILKQSFFCRNQVKNWSEATFFIKTRCYFLTLSLIIINGIKTFLYSLLKISKKNHLKNKIKFMHPLKDIKICGFLIRLLPKVIKSQV